MRKNMKTKGSSEEFCCHWFDVKFVILSLLPVVLAAAAVRQSSLRWAIAFQSGLGTIPRLSAWRKFEWYGEIRVSNRCYSACASTSYLKTRRKAELDTARWDRSLLTWNVKCCERKKVLPAFTTFSSSHRDSFASLSGRKKSRAACECEWKRVRV